MRSGNFQHRLNDIVSESINSILYEKSMHFADMSLDDIKALKNDKNLSDKVKDFLDKIEKRELNKKNKKKKHNFRSKKTTNGVSSYDYEEYIKSNPKLNKSDVNSIIDRIDTERTNIADLAREVFPDHTPEGAQSQLRKILNRERPMTVKVANKLAKYLSSNNIAQK